MKQNKDWVAALWFWNLVAAIIITALIALNVVLGALGGPS